MVLPSWQVNEVISTGNATANSLILIRSYTVSYCTHIVWVQLTSKIINDTHIRQPPHIINLVPGVSIPLTYSYGDTTLGMSPNFRLMVTITDLWELSLQSCQLPLQVSNKTSNCLKFTAASRGFPTTVQLSCIICVADTPNLNIVLQHLKSVIYAQINK